MRIPIQSKRRREVSRTRLNSLNVITGAERIYYISMSQIMNTIMSQSSRLEHSLEHLVYPALCVMAAVYHRKNQILVSSAIPQFTQFLFFCFLFFFLLFQPLECNWSRRKCPVIRAFCFFDLIILARLSRRGHLLYNPDDAVLEINTIPG